MKINRYETLQPNIVGNSKLREPQIEGFQAISSHFGKVGAAREIGIVLPVGCGKSGLIAVAPFATKATRALVVAPGIRIARQLLADMDPTSAKGPFVLRTGVLAGVELPEVAEIRGKKTNVSDLEGADVVVTNIQQLQGEDNPWLAQVNDDFFDLILFDEAHHNVAASWEMLRKKFPRSHIVNLSATPTRADGSVMEGEIVYSFPIYRAIEMGYVKRLKAKVLNPSTLKYVRDEGGSEVEVSLEEVRALGESDADFRRSIVSSRESLATIIDRSIHELRSLRHRTGDDKHKIIASALNQRHCMQIAAAYEERGIRAAYVHTKEDGAKNEAVLRRLEAHELAGR